MKRTKFFKVKYKISGSRARTVVVQEESEDAARRLVSDLITRNQMDNNWFVNLDYIEVEPYLQE